MVSIVALVLLVGFAGCLSMGSDGVDESDENLSVEYTIESGDVPDKLASVTLTMQVVFVEKGGDFSDNTCWRETYTGPYKPETTPIHTPSGECHRTESVTVNLTELDGPKSIEETAPGRFDVGHGLIVTDIDATHKNGTSITAINGIGGYRANIVEGEAKRSYTVEFGIGVIDGEGWRGSDYYFSSDTD